MYVCMWSPDQRKHNFYFTNIHNFIFLDFVCWHSYIFIDSFYILYYYIFMYTILLAISPSIGLNDKCLTFKNVGTEQLDISFKQHVLI